MSKINWKTQAKPLLMIVAVFLFAYHLPVGKARFDNAIFESLHLLKEYAREHVILCLVPAFFIAGAIAVFISQASVMKYLGAGANKVLAYGVASVSGTILAVCSCTVLPLFAGIYRMGAGLGPATTFLYSGPAINVLAILLTARVLGPKLGIARAVGAIIFSIVIGLLMHFIFRKEEHAKAQAQAQMPTPDVTRPLWQNGLFFATMVGVLISATWAKPHAAAGFWYAAYSAKWFIAGGFATAMGLILVMWFKMVWWRMACAALPPIACAFLFPGQPLIAFSTGIVTLSFITSRDSGEGGEWFESTWGLAKQILPLLFFGVLIAGALLGRPGHEGLIPSEWVARAVGGNSIWSNLFASVAGAFMYFATLTEVPILKGLMNNGMGQGPALALLLAGPALSLPNMLVIRSVMGTKKTVVYVVLVVVMATISGMIYGRFV
jgi:uncharacterized protein